MHNPLAAITGHSLRRSLGSEQYKKKSLKQKTKATWKQGDMILRRYEIKATLKLKRLCAQKRFEA